MPNAKKPCMASSVANSFVIYRTSSHMQCTLDCSFARLLDGVRLLVVLPSPLRRTSSFFSPRSPDHLRIPFSFCSHSAPWGASWCPPRPAAAAASCTYQTDLHSFVEETGSLCLLFPSFLSFALPPGVSRQKGTPARPAPARRKEATLVNPRPKKMGLQSGLFSCGRVGKKM